MNEAYQHGLDVMANHAMSDIEFNPKNTINCLAYSVALFVPFKQARDNMHTLVDRVANELGRSQQKLGFNYGYAVVLPSKRTEGIPPASVHIDILCDGIG